MKAVLRAIEGAFPRKTLTNQDLETAFPEWPAARIENKLGIVTRHIAAEDECSSDLAVRAAAALFASGACRASEIDYLLFCTQTPDYLLPTTACLLQDRLGIPTSAGALDFNLGCSGYVYGLSLAKGLVETGQARNVLLLTAETYSKLIHPADKGVRTIFGDAATASLIQAADDGTEGSLGPFVFGTDGRGGENLIVPAGGMRKPFGPEGVTPPGVSSFLHMNGGEIFEFTQETIPRTVEQLLAKAGIGLPEVDHVVFHQANKHILDFLRVKCGVPPEKFVVSFRDYGNTVSNTIPLALRDYAGEGKLKTGALTMLVGFGVGYSWGACFLRPGWFQKNIS